MANTFNLGNGNWAQKTEKVLAYNAENNNYKPLPFDFDRASTATRVNKQGLIETVGVDVPRIDYTGNSKGHLLLEPQSTNLITYSEDFSNVAWEFGGDVAFESGYTAPDGTNTAYKVTGTSGALAINASATSTQTRSIYAKTLSGTGTVQLCTHNSNTNNIFTITPQWQRFEINTTTSLTGVPFFYAVDFRGASTTLSEVILWGAQLEEGSYATSYIPTSGQSGGVTRSAETCSGAGNSTVFNDSEGVLYLETKPITDNYADNGVSFSSQINLSDGNLNNGANIRFRGTVLQCLYYNGSSYSAVLDYLNISVTETYKVAFLYKQSDFKMYVNGVLTDSYTFGSIGSFTLDRVTFDNSNGVNKFYGKVKDLRVYNTTLTDAELIALTS